MIIMREIGGGFLRREKDNGNDNSSSTFLYEVGDGRTEKKTLHALREVLGVRATMRSFEGRVSRQGKVGGGNKIAVGLQ